MKPPEDDHVLVEAVARIRLELGASGLSSALVETAGDGAPERVALVREDGVATIDLVGTLPDGSALHRRLRVPAEEGGDDAAVVAMRTVEMLRGIRLELPPDTLVRPGRTSTRTSTKSPRKTPTAPAPAAPMLDAPAEPPEALELFRVSIGADVLKGRLSNPSIAVGATLSLALAVTEHVSITGTFAGPFFTELAPTDAGSAHTREELGYLGLRVDSGGTRATAHLFVASGMHHLRATYDDRGRVTGVPASQLLIRTPQTLWSPLVAVGSGVGGRVWRRLGLSFELAAVFTQPAINVVVNGRSVGGVGGPSVISNVSLWTAFP